MKGRSDKADVQRGARIRSLRKAREWNQAELAVLIGVDQSTVSDMERGSSFSADLLMRLAEALGVTPTLVMKGEDEEFWPFRHVGMQEFMALEPKDRDYLEGVLAGKMEDLSAKPTEADMEAFRASHVRMKRPATKRKAA